LNESPAPEKTEKPPLAALLRGLNRGEVFSAAAILFIALIAWAYIATLPPMTPPSSPTPDMAGMPMDMPGMMMDETPANTPAPWTWARAFATFSMWYVMMAAMMLPAAAPIVLLHRRTAAHAHAQGAPAPPTSLLVLGYTLVWVTFAALATALQGALSNAGLLNDMDAIGDRAVAGAVLVTAGLYQLTPLKQTCLKLCRSPATFLMRHYKPGAAGALRMGLGHGLYCLGCCWAAMALLFVGGVMNLIWIAGLAIFVLIEKALPFGRFLGIAAGLGALALGGYWLLAGLI
jgi:predicted metal-binding membrane protein